MQLTWIKNENDFLLTLHSGSDGLLKLWTIKNNECVKTMDEHVDKVWTLTVNEAEDRVVSGGGDSNLIIWEVSDYRQGRGTF